MLPSSEKSSPSATTVLRVTVEKPAPKAAPAPSVSGPEEAVNLARRAKLTREPPHQPEPELSVMRHRKLWLPPLLAEAVLCIGAAWLAISLESVMWAPDHAFPLFSFAVFALVHAALVLHSRARELFMPRSVVFVGVGSLMLIAAGVGVYLVIEGYLVGGLYRLRYMPLVLVPLGLFLTRGVFVFRAARAAPLLSRLHVSARIQGRGMRSLRAKLRYWLRG